MLSLIQTAIQEPVVGDIYQFSTGAVCLLGSLLAILLLLSIFFFIKLAALQAEIVQMKDINDTSFATMRDWITLLVEEKLNVDDESFAKAIEKVNKKVEEREYSSTKIPIENPLLYGEYSSDDDEYYEEEDKKEDQEDVVKEFECTKEIDDVHENECEDTKETEHCSLKK